MIPHSRPDISEEDIGVVVAALRAGNLAQGAEVDALEKALETRFPGMQAVVTSSGTAALYLSLVALGAGPGKHVIIPSYTCNSLFSAVHFTGAEAVLADCGERDVNMTPSTVTPLISASVTAIILPHTCGYLADINGMIRLGIPVIEDCAQAIGGVHADGSALGSKGIVSILSFYATKLLPSGEGGACLTRIPEIAARVRRLRDCDKQSPDPRAFNFKMTDLCAALTRSRLARLDQDLTRRNLLAARYDAVFGKRSFRTSSSSPQAVCFRYLLDAGADATRILRESESAGIACRHPIWLPLHRNLVGHCPEADRLHESLVSIPLYPNLDDRAMEQITRTLDGLLQ